MGAFMSSIVTKGQVINGMCYSLAIAGGGDLHFPIIPPERVGLKGEYDHHGLAKRVLHQCRHVLGRSSVENLRVKQRGSVVVLYGCVSSQTTLEQIIQIAMQAEGATNVEILGVEVCEPLAAKWS